jgi:integrase/recombinase XerC
VDDLLQQYTNHLRNERNVSPHTLRNYLSDLAQFQNFLRERELCLDSRGDIDVRRVDIHVVRAFLSSLTRHRKKSSVGRKLAALKGFFRYLIANKQVDKDPLLLIQSPKQEKPLPTFLSVDDAFQLLGGIKVKTGLDVRDRAVLEVFLFYRRASERVGRLKLG